MTRDVIRLVTILVLGIGAGFAAPVEKATQSPLASKADAPSSRYLDKKRIHELYSDGDFDMAVAIIDSFTRGNPAYPKDDSVFVAKHLAVIYSANPNTREKGKGYMFQLLDLLPSAKIVDMFVSDEIDRVFQKVREEYAVRLSMMGRDPRTSMQPKKYPPEGSTGSPPGDSAAPIAAPKKASKSRLAYWVAGGTALAVGAGALVYLMMPKETDKNYDIPR
jgi:hypothetical protein